MHFYQFKDQILVSLEKEYPYPSLSQQQALSKAKRLTLLVDRDPAAAKASYRVNSAALFCEKEERLAWLDAGSMRCDMALPPEIERLIKEGNVQAVNTAYPAFEERLCASVSPLKKRVNLLALGDVGGTLLIGLKLLGGNEIESIGICDVVSQQLCTRWEYEMNQTAYPWDYDAMPQVHVVEKEDLFDCDVFIFCASRGVPPVGKEVKDVRMIQFEANAQIIREYAQMARKAKFQGLFAVVSDPVDPLCKTVFLESNRDENGALDFCGLRPEQIQGYGLGVMNSRAAYYAKKEERFESFLSEGRAFGPHGNDLVIANSVEHYDDALSKELTQLAVEANLRTRETGFKPYIAPALSSGAISILLTLRGEWHYSSNFLGGVYMGCKNRLTSSGLEMESLQLPRALFSRIENAYDHLKEII